MKRPCLFQTEQELASRIVTWFQDQEWEVYQEVQLRPRERCADIVARRGPVLAVVETKLQFGLTVIGQAQWWTHEAHYVYVAVPSLGPRTSKGRSMAWALCHHFGIGILIASESSIHEDKRAEFHRRVGTRLRDGLNDAQKNWAVAGNSVSSHWSPFKQTCREIHRYVLSNPGASLKETIDGIEHHYSSPATARGAIAKWIRLGKIKDVRIEYAGDRIKLYAQEAVP